MAEHAVRKSSPADGHRAFVYGIPIGLLGGLIGLGGGEFRLPLLATILGFGGGGLAGMAPTVLKFVLGLILIGTAWRTLASADGNRASLVDDTPQR